MVRQKHSPMVFVLKGLMPYSRENVLLSFRPKQFFDELEASSKYNRNTLRSAYWRAQQSGLIKSGSSPRLTNKGEQTIKPYLAERLEGEVRLLVVFDIPESYSNVRRQFRTKLKEWQFQQIQKSVWSTNKDYRAPLRDLISELNIGNFVNFYESVQEY